MTLAMDADLRATHDTIEDGCTLCHHAAAAALRVLFNDWTRSRRYEALPAGTFYLTDIDDVIALLRQARVMLGKRVP